MAMVRSWGVDTAVVAMASKQLSTGSATKSECNQIEPASILATVSIAFVAAELAEQR